MATRITERFTFSGGKVRRPGVDGFTGAYPVVEGVVFCGRESANRRRYRATAFGRPDQKRYAGRLIFLNHGKGHEGRQYESKLGWVESETRDAQGRPVGTIGVNPKHPYAETFLFDAEHRPADIGMSHVAECETVRGADGWDEVTDVVRVESVDVVTDPATTGGLFENRGGGKPMTVREYLNKLGPKLLVNQLLVGNRLIKEYGDAAMMDAAPAADAPETDGGDGVTAAVKAAAAAAIDECVSKSSDPEAVRRCLQRLKKILGLHGELSGEEPAKGGEEEEEETPKESRGKRPDVETISEECAAARFDPKAHDLVALSHMTAAAARKKYIEARLAESKPGETVRSAGRRPGAGSAAGNGLGGRTTTTEQTEPGRLIPKW